MFYPRYFRQRVQCISRGVSDSYSSGIATPPNRIGKKKHSTNFRPNSVPSGNMRIWMSAKVRNSGTREVSLDLGCIASFRRNSGGEWNEEEEGEKKKQKKKQTTQKHIALSYPRCCMESLTSQLWSRISKRGAAPGPAPSFQPLSLPHSCFKM